MTAIDYLKSVMARENLRETLRSLIAQGYTDGEMVAYLLAQQDLKIKDIIAFIRLLKDIT